MAFNVHAYTADGEKNPLFWPFLISFAGHILLFGIILFKPNLLRSETPYFPSVIQVQMVGIPETKPAPADLKPEAASVVQPPVAETPKAEVPVKPEVSVAPAAKPEVSIASRPEVKTKTALKYKTYKPEKVRKNTLDRLVNKVESAPTAKLQDTIKRLKEQVEKTEKDRAGQAVSGTGAQESKPGLFAAGSRQEAELIDIYRTEIAYSIQKNWAFAEQLSGGAKNLMASIVIRVMPDGTIQDVFFIDRSGNAYLDESAHKAIVKSSPVQPHPQGLGRSYVEMGLRFTPDGVQ